MWKGRGHKAAPKAETLTKSSLPNEVAERVCVGGEGVCDGMLGVV